jgi:predicted DNA-binding transcriptional regulator YafY
MSRTDILFQMTQIIRSRNFTTAQYLADRLNLSIRTIYRYVNDLSLAGVPILSQTGKGYWIDKSFDVPPIQLSEEEMMALSLGSKLVKAFADPFLADAAQQLLDKVESVTPKTHQHLLYQSKVHAPANIVDKDTARSLGIVRKAVDANRKIDIHYQDEQGQKTQRTLWPLAVAFWGQSWTLAAWCESRDDFRAFRIDRIGEINTLKTTFIETPGRTLADFIKHQKPLT